jgi:hypothetical protein
MAERLKIDRSLPLWDFDVFIILLLRIVFIAAPRGASLFRSGSGTARAGIH